MVLCLATATYVGSAQEQSTSTPVRAELPTLAPPVIEAAITSTPTRTPTPEGLVLLEAKPDAGDVNVRAEPDIGAERLGSIRAGRTYTVFGRYFRWIQFQFDDAPTGTVRAWVFDELINIIGDENAIPNLEPGAQPTATPEISLGEVEAPGNELTATANARTLSLPGAELSSSGTLPQVAETPAQQALPTFTYPPNVVATLPATENGAPEPTQSPVNLPVELPDGVPPIAPIILLGGLGLLGLAVSSLRR